MAPNRSIFGLFALILVLLVGFSGPAAAEFFGCKDTRGQVLSSTTTVQDEPIYRRHHSSYSGRHTNYSRSYTPRRRHRATVRYVAHPARRHHAAAVYYYHGRYYYGYER